MTVRWHAAAAAILVVGAALGVAGSDGPVQNPQQALGLLKAGNDRFVRNVSKPVPLGVNRRRELTSGQQPAAMILSCADSRVPPEHVFNAGLGELFVIRTAGEVIDRSILATLEYGVEHLRIPLLVVMGHESCGAVAAAADAKGNPGSANMSYLLKAIQAARRTVPQDQDAIRALILANVEQVINDAMAGSPSLQRAVDTGQLGVVGAYYELASGRVMFSEPVAPGGAAPGASH